MRVLVAFIKKELTQTFRDPRFRFILFGPPVLQLIIFGYVVTTEIKQISMVVVDYDQSRESRELVSDFSASGYFNRVGESTVPIAHPEDLLYRNKAKIALVIPPDFSENIGRNTTAQVQIVIDGADANAAIITKGYIEGIMSRYTEKLLMQRQAVIPQIAQRAMAGIVNPEIRILYNEEMKSSHFMVPGLICLILLIVTALLTAVAVTREKELGTLEQLIVSPLSRWQFILGKTLPYVLVGLVDIALVLVVGKALFDIPMRGSLVFLFATAVIFLFTTLGIGLLAASVSKNQAQAMLTVFPILMPAFLLSGMVFPVASIPIGLRWIAYINPITYYLTVVRGILIKGAGFVDLYRELIALIVFGAFSVVFSSLRFRKQLE